MDYCELSKSLISIFIIFFSALTLVEFSFGKLLFRYQIKYAQVLIS